MFKRLYTTIFLMFLCVNVFADDIEHLIRPGETLYSLAKYYNVTVEAIQAANPSIEGTTIKSGMTLIIPDLNKPKTPAVVAAPQPQQKQEEVEETTKKKKGFSLFKKKDKKDKKGKKDSKDKQETQVVTTPVPQAVSVVEPVQKTVVTPEVPTKRVKRPGAPDNVVMILPFNLNSKTSTEDKQQMRSVEFYEGFLLAVDEAQKAGQKILIQTYDLGTKSMAEILATQSLKDADVIIAPMDTKDVSAVAEYGKKNDINVVSPFVFSSEDSKGNEHLIQLNTSNSLLYENLTKDVIRRFKNYDFVFLTDSSHIAKTDPYAQHLKKAMKENGIRHYDFSYKTPEKLARVDSILRIVGNDILYIPTVNSKETLQGMFPSLRSSVFVGGNESDVVKTPSKISVLGYPEWILYANDFMSDYYDMDVHMFSKFYANPFDESVKEFYRKFHYWFDKEPMPLNPRYALLGYDVGRYFLAAIRQYGMYFNEHLENFSKETLQFKMSFEKDGEGWINKGLYLVHFQQSTQIEKYEIE